MRVFEDSHINSAGKVLDKKDFRLFCDLKDPYQGILLHKEEILRSAEQYLEKEYPVIFASDYMYYQRAGERFRFEDKYALRRGMLFEFLLAEYVEKKGRFIDRLIDGIWLILEESSWVIHAHNVAEDKLLPMDYKESNVNYIDLFSAQTGALLSFVLFYLKDALDGVTPIICERIKYELNRRIIKPFLGSCKPWWMGMFGESILNNWATWITSGVLNVCALAVDETSVKEEVTEKAIRILDNFTKTYPDDGGCEEGPGYWSAAGAAYFDCLELIYDITGGKVDVFGNPVVKNMGEYIYKVNIFDNKYLNFADAHLESEHDYYMVRRFGRRINSQRLEAFGQNKLELVSMFEGEKLYFHCYRRIKGLSEESNGIALKYKVQKQVYLEKTGVLVVRETENEGEGLMLSVKGGNNGESHGHNDVGNIVVFKDKNPVLIDPGVGTYNANTFNENRNKLWTIQSAYHNLPTVNACIQLSGEVHRASKASFDEKNGFITMEIGTAYPKDAGIKSYIRTSGIKDGQVVITDKVELEREGDLTLSYMTLTKPQIQKGKMTFDFGAEISFDESLNATVEEIVLNDAVLERDWQQPQIYRVLLRPSGKIQKAQYVMIIK